MEYKVYLRTVDEEEILQDFEPEREDAIVKAIRLRRRGLGEAFVIKDPTGAVVFRVG
ncbi:hypothetical protein [Mesoterricola sediminis]|uniref:Uncharacterized protein n=1 Tax=Mesoterricola sediminis TaxID=2927980 RepID=A0AA48H0W2_9BACT|nr:hypothetical protein [Mesoterricola sediminis]BDU77970.1 hypothetical protein METESE_29280 [Mesoterricola sediminis]